MKAFNVIVQVYNNTQEVEVAPKCNGWTARNIGSTVCVVNGITLQPPPGAGQSGESIEISGNEGEIYQGRIQLRFNNVVGAAVEIIQKYYLS